ncbi:hypothetical protein ACVH9Z_34265 [Rhodococcus opacus]|nr:hypothetical protein [Rhodococcus opacus]
MMTDNHFDALPEDQRCNLFRGWLAHAAGQQVTWRQWQISGEYVNLAEHPTGCGLDEFGHVARYSFKLEGEDTWHEFDQWLVDAHGLYT